MVFDIKAAIFNFLEEETGFFFQKFPLLDYSNESWKWIKKSEFFVVNGLSRKSIYS